MVLVVTFGVGFGGICFHVLAHVHERDMWWAWAADTIRKVHVCRLW
jgi:hypothetical protein